jgi:hypothetical protein
MVMLLWESVPWNSAYSLSWPITKITSILNTCNGEQRPPGNKVLIGAVLIGL